MSLAGRHVEALVTPCQVAVVGMAAGSFLSTSSVPLAMGSHPQPPTLTNVWIAALEGRLKSS